MQYPPRMDTETWITPEVKKKNRRRRKKSDKFVGWPQEQQQKSDPEMEILTDKVKNTNISAWTNPKNWNDIYRPEIKVS